MNELTLLFVEDEEMLREQLLKFLQRRFKKVLVAENGAQGLMLYQQHTPDLILTDIQMPKMTGLEMVAEIREIDKITPIVILTAFSDVENLKKAIELKVDRFISKPAKREELEEVLKKATEIVLHKRKIKEQEKIIETILGWQPYFSIISDGDYIEHIGKNFLNFLGYNTKEEFIEHHKNIKIFFEHMADLKNYPAKDLQGEALFKYLLGHTDKDHVIYLKNAKCDNLKAYALKSRYFQSTGLYLLAFLDAKIYLDDVFQNCAEQTRCGICKFD